MNKNNIDTLIFDADDTLWENNIFFLKATWAYYELFPKNSAILERVKSAFSQTEKQIVQTRGCGSVSFVQILEQLTGRFRQAMIVPDPDQSVKSIIDTFLDHRKRVPPLFDFVLPTLRKLARSYRLLCLTKGQFDEQADKMDKSGLKDFFEEVVIVPDKTDATYKDLISRFGLIAERTVMIGNSQKSDINPALRCGMYAIYIPYDYTWTMDREDLLAGHPHLTTIQTFRELTDLL